MLLGYARVSTDDQNLACSAMRHQQRWQAGIHMFGARAEFERTLIRERTRAGLAAARAHGRKGGRPKLLDVDQRALALRLYQERQPPPSPTSAG